MNVPRFRGSRKHVLDLLDRPDCLQRLNGILGDIGIEIRSQAATQGSTVIRLNGQSARLSREHMVGWRCRNL